VCVGERERERERGVCHRAIWLRANNTKQTVHFKFRIEPFVDKLKQYKSLFSAPPPPTSTAHFHHPTTHPPPIPHQQNRAIESAHETNSSLHPNTHRNTHQYILLTQYNHCTHHNTTSKTEDAYSLHHPGVSLPRDTQIPPSLYRVNPTAPLLWLLKPNLTVAAVGEALNRY
jgi:hypothetical protein